MRALLAAVALAGCIDDPTTACGELRCAPSEVCTTGGCAAPEAAAACAGKVDRDPCTTAAIPHGACGGGACHPIICGDGIVDPGEACDDGNTDPDDGCSTLCDSTELCGNGVVDLVHGEECDSGVSQLSGDGCSSRCALERPTWRNVTPSPIGEHFGAAAAYDDARQVIVMFGGASSVAALDETWEWNGTDWTRKTPPIAPAPRDRTTMAYDAFTGQLVLFGGNGPVGQLADTWTWDGVIWTQLSPATSPPPRGNAAMAYDPVRHRIVLFGGNDAGGALGDTWEWDGTTWLDVTPASGSPSARFSHAMTFDPQSAQMLMYGGTPNANQIYTETWLWNGTAWAQQTIGAMPDGGYEPSAAAVDGFVFLFGGYSGTFQPQSTTWRWTGASWDVLVSSASPPPRGFQSMVFDVASDRAVLFGGLGEPLPGTFVVENDTWQWLGATWVQTPSGPASPPFRSFSGAAYDARRGETVLFGGETSALVYQDTWVWDGNVWVPRTSTPVPPARAGHAMAYDLVRDRVVMFDGSQHLADTWEWDGGGWTQRHPVHSPPAREAAAITYDEHLGRIVLYGGYSGVGALGDMWTWDGTDWTQLHPATLPPARSGVPFVYDRGRARIVMFGGDATWEWDGTTWMAMHPAVAPPPRSYQSLIYDPGRQRVLLFGGETAGGSPFSDTWEWDGATWTALVPTTVPFVRHGASMVYDAAHRRGVLVGGSGIIVDLGDTWTFAFESSQPGERCLLPTEDSDGDGLAGCADPDCFGRCSPWCMPGVSCAGPSCGDGVCDPVETVICPADCL